jgi:hypothetical protein
VNGAMANRIVHEMLEGVARGVLAIVIVVGSAFTWIGVPLTWLWLAGRITTDPQHVLLLVLCAIPTSMVVFGFLLYRLSRVYEMLRGPREGAMPQRTAWLRASSDQHRRNAQQKAPRQLIDTAMIASAWTAVVLMMVWFFFVAELRLVSP